jgi:hypothetical protein
VGRRRREGGEEEEKKTKKKKEVRWPSWIMVAFTMAQG